MRLSALLRLNCTLVLRFAARFSANRQKLRGAYWRYVCTSTFSHIRSSTSSSKTVAASTACLLGLGVSFALCTGRDSSNRMIFVFGFLLYYKTLFIYHASKFTENNLFLPSSCQTIGQVVHNNIFL